MSVEVAKVVRFIGNTDRICSWCVLASLETCVIGIDRDHVGHVCIATSGRQSVFFAIEETLETECDVQQGNPTHCLPLPNNRFSAQTSAR